MTPLPQPLRIADDFEQRWIVVEEIAALTGRHVREIIQLFHALSSDGTKRNKLSYLGGMEGFGG